MTTPNTDDFNVIQFEKRLQSLKDSQEHINACCRWCLENRQHHKKIVNSWLNVLKRVKIEQRVNLFYLANDVIQYSKRKNYEFVESWGTALQKATTLVRDDKVKHKIVRIFNIWQQRNVYNEEFISDLCGLISVVPTASKNDEPHEFQANYVINKIKHCSKLENETDTKLKVLKEHNPKIQLETESLCTSLKDRAHVDDVEKELETYVKHLEGYINALKAEIKCRINNISVLKQANTQLEKDKRDVKVVANAYKTFGARIKTFQKKLEEHRATLISPIPSPDINAPSPSPDSDLELPDDNENKINNTLTNFNTTEFTAGYYNPVPPPTTESNPNFVTNGYTSFIGSNFTIPNSLFTNTQTTVTPSTNLTEVTNSNTYGGVNSNLIQPLTTPHPQQQQQQPPLPPPPIETSTITETTEQSFTYHQTNNSGHMPLLPPPMPPFSTNDPNYNPYSSTADNKTNFGIPANNFNTSVYDTSFNRNLNETYNNSSSYHQSQTINDYNRETETNNWKRNWPRQQQSLLLDNNTIDTPESPPIFEKEGFTNETVEYHDNVDNTGAVDVDHRILRHAIPSSDNVRNSRGKDVDHRNLISLTGSPASDISQNNNTTIWNNLQDQDYRTSTGDHDYRLPPSFNIEQLKLPPPPPPPPSSSSSSSTIIIKKQSSPRKIADSNVESIDMELSEDENDLINDNNVSHQSQQQQQPQKQDNLKVLVGNDVTLKPPPPLPDLPEDVDANHFLDGLNNDLNSQDFPTNLTEIPPGVDQQQHHEMVGPQHHYTPTGVQPPPPPPPPLPPPHPEMYIDNNSGGCSGNNNDNIIPNNPWSQQQQQSNFIIRNNDNNHHYHRGGGFNNIRNHHQQRGRGRNFGFHNNINNNNSRIGGNSINRGRGGFGNRNQGQNRHRIRGNMRGGNFR